MKDLLKYIRKEFDIVNPNSTFVDVCEEIEYIQETYIYDSNDLLTNLVFINLDKEMELVYSN